MPTRAASARRGIGRRGFFERTRRVFFLSRYATFVLATLVLFRRHAGLIFFRRYAALISFRRYAALADGIASTA